MPILNITSGLTGQAGVTPRIVYVDTNDSFDRVTTENYLQPAMQQGFAFNPNDIIALTYGNNVSQFFTLDMSGGNITLEPMSGDVDLPVTVNHIAVFTSTSGNIGDNATVAINEGSIHAGLSGAAGSLASFPATASTGALYLTGVSNAANYNVIISNSSHGQSTTYSINDVGQGTGWLMNCINSTDPGANLISFDITVGQAALAAGGSVILIDSSGSKQYKIRSLQINSGGTNFSGGGGNRLGQITDGTTVYSVIPAASMQTLANAQWGATALPNPASAAINTSTVAGADLVFKYSGGTTDYTAGSIVVSGIVQRIA